MRVKKLVKVGLSEGGGIQLDFFLKGGFCHDCYCEKNIVLACESWSLELIPGFICIFFKSFGGGGNKG